MHVYEYFGNQVDDYKETIPGRYTVAGASGEPFICFVHDVIAYRYHWHNTMYEVSVVISGRARFSYGGRTVEMEAGDVIVINPGIGHASFSMEPETRAFVLRFPAAEFRNITGEERLPVFSVLSDENTRNSASYKKIRMYCAQLILSLCRNDARTALLSENICCLLLDTLLEEFETARADAPGYVDEGENAVINGIFAYVDENFRSKITLEDIAELSHYNRTYISTFFKNYLGMNFYDYLTNVRFRSAAFELISTDKSLTEIALGNGFPELKTFNRKFKELLNISPAEYRSQVKPEYVPFTVNFQRYYVPSEEPIVSQLMRYIKLEDVPAPE